MSHTRRRRTRQRLFAWQQGRCPLCNCVLVAHYPQFSVVDRIVPDGPGTVGNLRLVHPECKEVPRGGT